MVHPFRTIVSYSKIDAVSYDPWDYPNMEVPKPKRSEHVCILYLQGDDILTLNCGTNLANSCCQL